MTPTEETTAAIRVAINDAIQAAEDGRSGSLFPAAQSFAAYQAASHGHQLLVDVLGQHDDLENARLYRFRVLWRTTRWKSGGLDVAGSCAPVKDRERDLYGLDTHYEVTMNLAWWLSLDQHGRERLMHHELKHAATNHKAHPVEEWPGTVRRFGLGSRAQALLVVEALQRETLRDELEALLRDEDPAIPGWLP